MLKYITAGLTIAVFSVCNIYYEKYKINRLDSQESPLIGTELSGNEQEFFKKLIAEVDVVTSSADDASTIANRMAREELPEYDDLGAVSIPEETRLIKYIVLISRLIRLRCPALMLNEMTPAEALSVHRMAVDMVKSHDLEQSTEANKVQYPASRTCIVASAVMHLVQVASESERKLLNDISYSRALRTRTKYRRRRGGRVVYCKWYQSNAIYRIYQLLSDKPVASHLPSGR